MSEQLFIYSLYLITVILLPGGIKETYKLLSKFLFTQIQKFKDKRPKTIKIQEPRMRGYLNI